MEKKPSNVKRFIPLIILLFLMFIVYLFDLADYFTFEELKKHHKTLKGFVSSYPLLSPLIYIAIYFVSTALSLPGGALLSIVGGFLFAQPLATLYVVIGATLGATCIFLVATSALGKRLIEKAGPMLQKMQKGFQENAASYLLFLRLIPLFPFWLVNIAPAFFGVSLFTFAWTTFVGIIPGAFVFTQAGAGLGSILETEGQLSIDTIFTWDVRVALIALAIFALLPVAIKKFRNKKT